MNSGLLSAYVKVSKGRFKATPLTIGPWSVEQQHAGPPIALALREFERFAVDSSTTTHQHHSSSSSFHVARITANLYRPVPVGEISIETRLDFGGKNVKHLSSSMFDVHSSKEVARFTCVVHREVHVETPSMTTTTNQAELPSGFRTVEQSDKIEFPVKERNQVQLYII